MSSALPVGSGSLRSLPLVRGLPLVGVVPALLDHPIQRLLKARDRYGDIFSLDLGVTRWAVLCHPRYAEHVLVTHADRYRKGGPVWEAAAPLLGNGLVISEGDFWRRQRRLLQPHFHRQQLAALTTLMVDAIAETLDSWQPTIESSQPMNLSAGFAAITMRVIARTLFGQHLASAEIERVSELMAHIFAFLPLGIASRLLPRWLPLPGAQRYRQQLAELDAIVHRLIAVERSAAAPSSSLLALLVREALDGGMTNQQLRDEVMTFFLAGYETTSLALSWAVTFMLEQPDILQKVHAELDRSLGARAPAFSDLAALAYTRTVINETLRMTPPSWWLPRSATVDDELDGYHIPAGTMVVIFTYAIHHHPTLWPSPERFIPERFSTEEAASRHRLAFMPFGAGQRVCIGKEFALMEAVLVLAMFLQRCTLRPVPGINPQPRIGMTLRPKGEVKAFLERRPLPKR